jgi:modulator of FtsH protease
MRNPYDVPYYRGGAAGGLSTTARSGLLAKVSGLLAFSMAFTVAGAFVGMQVPGLGLPAIIGVLVLSFVVGLARNVSGLNLVLLYTLTTLMGVALGGIVEAYVAAGAGAVVVEAGVTTGVMTLGLSAYALTTKRDFSSLGGKLFVALLALIVASIVSIFVSFGPLQILIGFGGAVLFSLYLIFQVQQVRYAEDTLGNAIVLAVGIYLSIINLFLSLLRLFTALGGGGGSRR